MENRLFLIFLSALFLSWNAVAFSAPGVKGKIIESGKDIPIESADVTLLKKEGASTVAHTYSDQNGIFVLKGIQKGEYSLSVRIIGYSLYTLPSIVFTDTTEMLDVGTIELNPLENGLSEVVIEADKKRVIYKLDKKIIDATSNIMASGGTAVDVLENAPSIRVDAERGVTFRGSSGFAVYIDGKPSLYSGTQALQQIPAGLIDNIELITTPSARNDTDGDAGIINIITKKDRKQGLNGMVNMHGSTALSSGFDFLITQQNEKFRWHISGEANQPVRKSEFDQNKTTIVEDTSTVSHSHGPRRSRNYFHNLRGGMDYTMNNTVFNLNLEVGNNKFTRDGDLHYRENQSIAGGESKDTESESLDEYDLHSTHYHGDVGFSHKFNDDGHKLAGRFLLRYEGDAMEYFQSDLFDIKTNERLQGHRAWEDENRWTVQGNVDYILPYSKTGKLESGYQYHSYSEDGDYIMHSWDPEKQEFYERDDIYNTFYFQRGIHSLYAMGSDSYKSFNFQAGLRGEYTHQVLRSSIEGADRTVDMFEIFPSLHLAYNMPDNQTLTFGYSYRTNRPELFFMEPYITYRDYYTAEIGNPDIRPEYINSFELSYLKNINDHTFTSSLFLRSRKDKIERLRVPYQAGVTLDSMANVGDDISAGVELNGEVKAFNWWSLNVNGNIYYYKIENHFKSGGRDETSINYDLTLSNHFDVHKNTRIQLDGNFAGPSVTTQGHSDAFWFVNFAVRQHLFDRKLAASLVFSDIFNTARYKNDINTSDLKSVTHITPQYPVIMLSLSYTFNNYKKQNGNMDSNRDLFEGTKH